MHFFILMLPNLSTFHHDYSILITADNAGYYIIPMLAHNTCIR